MGIPGYGYMMIVTHSGAPQSEAQMEKNQREEREDYDRCDRLIKQIMARRTRWLLTAWMLAICLAVSWFLAVIGSTKSSIVLCGSLAVFIAVFAAVLDGFTRRDAATLAPYYWRSAKSPVLLIGRLAKSSPFFRRLMQRATADYAKKATTPPARQYPYTDTDPG